MRKPRGTNRNVVSRTVVVKNEVGLHARPAKNLVAELNKYESEVYIEKDGYRVNAKSIIGVLTLAAVRGSLLTVIAEGTDAEEVVDVVERMFENYLGEEPAGETVKKLKGVAASPGIQIGKAYVVYSENIRVLPRSLSDEDVERDIERFRKAIEESKQEILLIKQRFKEQSNDPGLAEIFDTHIHVLEDTVLMEDTIDKVRKTRKNVEFVFSENLESIEKQFASVEDEYFQQRMHDIHDVGGRILRKLLRREKQSLSHLREKYIVISHDLTPADTASMDRQNVLAFATDAGGRTSHTAIMAKALEIPAVVGLKDITDHVRNDDIVIVDGLKGVVIVSPNEKTLNEYQIRRDRYKESERELEQLRDLPAQTLDGEITVLSANIDMPDEVGSALGHGAEGIGLFRTEYMYLNRTMPPTEDEQFHAYAEVARQVSPHPVTIRTLDIGGDKLLGHEVEYREGNPFMGCRAIRFCLNHPEIFKPQLRAILRAGAAGKVRLIFPMINSLSEFRQTKSVLEEAKRELQSEKIPFDTDMAVGIMIETPSAVLIADLLAREVDFFSIGSNDLIQYALAVDRVNERIAHLYEPAHPGILRMIKMVIDAANRESIQLSVCGEIAGDMSLALLLTGLGLKNLSMTASAIPEVKKLVRSVSLSDLKDFAARVLLLPTAEEVRSEVQRTISNLIPNSGKSGLFA